LRGEVLYLLDTFDDILIQQFLPNRAVAALDVGILLGLSWLDMLDGHAMFLSQDQQLATDLFLAVVDTSGLPRHSMIRSRLGMTRLAGSEKSTSMS
jgi:hypothetical protein